MALGGGGAWRNSFPIRDQAVEIEERSSLQPWILYFSCVLARKWTSRRLIRVRLIGFQHFQHILPDPIVRVQPVNSLPEPPLIRSFDRGHPILRYRFITGVRGYEGGCDEILSWASFSDLKNKCQFRNLSTSMGNCESESRFDDWTSGADCLFEMKFVFEFSLFSISSFPTSNPGV
mgnify:CR=1 FL=1